MDKILGLEYGADDYMTKPFNILEVKARIKTILRRVAGSVQQQEHRVIRVHDMEVNLIKRSVTLGGKDIKLTAKEFDLLQMFVTNRGTVFSREQMLETVWKYDYAVVVDQHQSAVHGGGVLLQHVVQFVRGDRLKKRSRRKGKLLGLHAVITRPLVKQVIADKSGQERRGHKKRKAHNEKKGQQDLPPDAGHEREISPDP